MNSLDYLLLTEQFVTVGNIVKQKASLLIEALEQKNDRKMLNYISFRIKEWSSLKKKLVKKQLEISTSSIAAEIKDIAGVRIVTNTREDLTEILDELRKSFVVLQEKDYINNPKPSGYMSHHIIVEVQGLPVELQLRTTAMDEYASIEHGARYKADMRSAEVDHEMARLLAIARKKDGLD